MKLKGCVMGILGAFRSILYATALIVLTGCATGYNLHISLDPDYAKELGDERVFIHVVPVNPHDRLQFETLSLNDYWKYEKPTEEIQQEKGTKALELSSDNPQAIVADDDPIWKQWQEIGATELMILSSRPIPKTQSQGETDPRRRFISAIPSQWETHDVKVLVTAGGLRVQSGEIQTSK